MVYSMRPAVIEVEQLDTCLALVSAHLQAGGLGNQFQS
jgi:hypothetical protein